MKLVFLLVTRQKIFRIFKMENSVIQNPLKSGVYTHVK